MAFLHSGEPRQPALNVPASVLLLVGALVAAHLARIYLFAGQSEQILMDYALIPLRYVPGAGDAGSLLDRSIPFVSYMFLHASATHLTLNCLWLIAFGSVVARRFRAVRFLLFFAICGVVAAFAYLALKWNSEGAVIGCSGAVSGLMAAGIRMLRTSSAPRTQAPLLPIFSSQVLMFTGFYIVANFVFGLSGIGVGSELQPVAWQAHLGGYFAGLFLAGLFDVNAPRLPGENTVDA